MINRTQSTAKAMRLGTLLAAAGLITACGTRQPAVETPEPPPPEATAQNSLVMPAVTYGTTGKGLPLQQSDDNCKVPALLRQAVENQLEAPLLYLLAAPTPSAASAPVLKVEVTDLLANAGGMYGGPKFVELHGTLERPSTAPVHFTAHRQMFMYIGFPRSTCSMVGTVAHALGGDILGWLKKPVDGAFLGER
ncbi:hypothetical protein [Variovorax ginsengisoli]|uniref:Lipoprotein n=1 Tax=Variovorax ginsengisoli TaxID=363844 RepID=A0ABT9S4D7_9BURK|nr:hypothetical protein [Variovorax ginsengisoli]MDP9899217.1 hypothetical protein [Variovorax ginsengisoli]